jgi:hypothetical protein
VQLFWHIDNVKLNSGYLVHIQSKLVMLKSYEPTILLLINQAFKISVQFTITMNRLYSYNLTEFKITRFLSTPVFIFQNSKEIDLNTIWPKECYI